jgi:hypothetical protein
MTVETMFLLSAFSVVLTGNVYLTIKAVNKLK